MKLNDKAILTEQMGIIWLIINSLQKFAQVFFIWEVAVEIQEANFN